MGWKERAVVGEKPSEALVIAVYQTNDMLNNHLSDLTVQNLKRLFADLHI